MRHISWDFSALEEFFNAERPFSWFSERFILLMRHELLFFEHFYSVLISSYFYAITNFDSHYHHYYYGYCHYYYCCYCYYYRRYYHYYVFIFNAFEFYSSSFYHSVLHLCINRIFLNFKHMTWPKILQSWQQILHGCLWSELWTVFI